MNYLKSVLIISVIFVMGGCLNSHHKRWTEKEIKDFECQCAKTDTFKNIVVLFNGFESNEFDSVLIKEYKDRTLTDSFKIFVFPSESPWDKEHKSRSGTISRTMNIKYDYDFIIPGQKPYRLSNIKMIVKPQWTMFSEGYGCEPGDFMLDGVKYENVGNPQITKRK
jgi:hypothetical protein